MSVFNEFLEGITNPVNRQRTEDILNWVTSKYPNLKQEVKWNQPMFTDHGTYIIGFSVSKKHLAVAPESVTISHVEEEIKSSGYDYTKEIVRIPWEDPVNYSILEKMIEFNIWDKKDITTFWRK